MSKAWRYAKPNHRPHTTLAGKIIKAIRVSEGITQKKLAETFGCAIGTVSSWEQGKTRPAFDDLNMICDHYGREITAEINKTNQST